MSISTVRSFIVLVIFNAKHIKDSNSCTQENTLVRYFRVLYWFSDTYTECSEGFVTVVYFGLCLNSLTEKYECSKLITSSVTESTYHLHTFKSIHTIIHIYVPRYHFSASCQYTALLSWLSQQLARCCIQKHHTGLHTRWSEVVKSSFSTHFLYRLPTMNDKYKGPHQIIAQFIYRCYFILLLLDMVFTWTRGIGFQCKCGLYLVGWGENEKSRLCPRCQVASLTGAELPRWLSVEEIEVMTRCIF